MATLSTAARNAAADAVVDLIDAGSGAGKLIIRDGSNVVLAELTLSDPAFGSASNGVATADAITGDSSANASGTAASFTLETSDGTVVITGTVGTSGADLNLVTTTIVAGQPVQVTSLTYTQPAS